MSFTFGNITMIMNDNPSNFVHQVEMEGLTGSVTFDTEGFRSNFNLEIVELRKEGLVKVGGGLDLN